MSAKKKFYVVWKGRKTGIHTTWDSCSASVSGYPGAEYKAFDSLPAAEAAYAGAYTEYKGVATSLGNWRYAKTKPLLPSLCVDAACSGNPGPMEYRGVDTESARQLFHLGPYEDGTNNVGEFLGIVHALAWLKREGRSQPIYSDSETAISWVRQGVCRTKLIQTGNNSEVFDLIRRAEAWLKENPTSREACGVYKWETQDWGETPADFGRK